MNIYKELPIVLPFYDDIQNQSINKEGVKGLLDYSLISTNANMLPFQIRLDVSKANPVSWKIVNIKDGSETDLSSQMSLIKVFTFDDFKSALYFGEDLGINLTCGDYYHKFIFADSSYLVSEIFTIVLDTSEFIRIDFWNTTDIYPVIYRNNWKQTLFIDSFISDYVPEIEEELDKDGQGTDIPIFQKMILKYEFVDFVPDFIKVALISMQIIDNVKFTMKNREGFADRVKIVAQPSESGGFSEIKVVFEDDILEKKLCNNDKNVVSLSNW